MIRRRPVMRITHRAALLAATLTFAVPFAARVFLSGAPSARAAAAKPRLQAQTPRQLRSRSASAAATRAARQKFLRRILPRLGSQVAFRKVARSIGVTEFRGKDLNPTATKSGVARMALDQPVDSFDLSQNQPSIAADPTDESTVVVFAQNEANFLGVDVACSIYLSFDAGVTYSYVDDVPLVISTDICAEPVVRFSPDGEVVYFNYLSIREDGTSSDIVVLVAEADDPTSIIAGPTIVLPGGPDFVDKNWLGVHTFDDADGLPDGGGFVYVTGTVFFSDMTCGLLINRSSDYGLSWDFGTGLTLGGGPSDCNAFFLHGARVAGGPGEQVLACYFNAEADGFSAELAPPTPSNRFDITCVSSGDRWATNSTPITAANNVGFELNLFLGPNENYHRWFPGMFPSVAIDHRGNAHVAFAADPNANKIDVESGNVQYMRSIKGALNPPYTAWVARVALGTGPRAQGFPNVVAQRSNLTANAYVYVAYYDHYRSLAAAPNQLYDVRYRRSINGGATFTPPVTVTDVVSLSDFLFIGDYFDTTTTMRRFHLAWTDRGDKTDIFDVEDDVFADRY
jgi:hypothetical protein